LYAVGSPQEIICPGKYRARAGWAGAGQHGWQDRSTDEEVGPPSIRARHG